MIPNIFTSGINKSLKRTRSYRLIDLGLIDISSDSLVLEI